MYSLYFIYFYFLFFDQSGHKLKIWVDLNRVEFQILRFYGKTKNNKMTISSIHDVTWCDVPLHTVTSQIPQFSAFNKQTDLYFNCWLLLIIINLIHRESWYLILCRTFLFFYFMKNLWLQVMFWCRRSFSQSRRKSSDAFRQTFHFNIELLSLSLGSCWVNGMLTHFQVVICCRSDNY